MTTRWKPAFEAINPRQAAETWEVGVAPDHFEKVQHAGHEKELARLLLVREVLEGGTVGQYEGWLRPDKDEDCYVYVGRPARDYRSYTIDVPAPTNCGFLVFVLGSGTIDAWNWRRLVNVEECIPEDVSGELIWSLNQS